MGNPLTVGAWREELAEARANRTAQASIGVTRSELMPVPGQLVAVLGTQDLIVAYDDEDQTDVLTAVYLLARQLAVLATNPDSEGIDLVAARRHATDLIDALTALDSVSRHAVAIHRAADAIVTTVSDVRIKVTERADALRASLTN